MDWESRVREQMQDRVWVDFNAAWGERALAGRHHRQVSLATMGSCRDLDRLGIELAEGMELRIYMEDQEADGRAGALVASGTVIHRPDLGWLVEIADDAIEWVGCD